MLSYIIIGDYMWKYDREAEFNKMLNAERNRVSKFLYILNMNNENRNEKLIKKQLELIKQVRDNMGIVNFVIDKHETDSTEVKREGTHAIIGTPGSDLVDEYKIEISKPYTRIYYKNNRNGIYNRALQDDITCYKNLKEILVSGIDVYDFALGLSSYLDEINMDPKILISRDTTDMKESFFYLNSLLDERGVAVVENLAYLDQLEKVYKLK